jgi:serine O-acetyltransferase
MLRDIRDFVAAARERDPAACGTPCVLLCYPGLKAVLAHRLAHALWTSGLCLPARVLSQLSRFFTGIEIHPGATIGRGLFIDHGMGVVIGETAEVGDNCTLYQGVTLGGTGKERGKRHPTLEDNVTVGAGAQILGAFTVGRGSYIGANSVVVKEVPPEATVVGIPGRIVRIAGERVSVSLHHERLPDPILDRLAELQREVEQVERNLRQRALARRSGSAAS